MKSNMKNKKTPASTTKKKSLPAATSRSCRKAAREVARGTQSNDGSYLLSDANIASDTPAMPSTSSNSPSAKFSNHTLMAFLQKLDDSTKQIMRPMDDLERQNTVNLTPVHSPTANARLVRIDDRPITHAHNQWDRTVSIDPVNSRELFTAQSLSTSHESTGHQKGNHHTLPNPGVGNHTGKSSHVRPSNSDPFASFNAHLNHAVFRSTDDSTVRHPIEEDAYC